MRGSMYGASILCVGGGGPRVPVCLTVITFFMIKGIFEDYVEIY